MQVVEQLCVKSFEIKAKNGEHWKAEQGNIYTTSIPSDENNVVRVFSSFWVSVPKECFVLCEKQTC